MKLEVNHKKKKRKHKNIDIKQYIIEPQWVKEI